MVRITEEATKRDVKGFWERNPLGLRENSEAMRELGTKAFFEHVERRRYAREWHIRALVPFARGRNKTVVELGCGLGTDAVQWARAGANYVDLDLAREQVNIASKRFDLLGLSGNFFEGDAENLPFVSEAADFAYSYGVLHHTPDMERALDELYRILQPGGTAVVMLSHRHSLQMLRIFLKAVNFYTLRFDAGVKVVHLLTKKPLDQLRAHQEYLKREPSFFMQGALARYVDGWESPIARACSRRQARYLFRRFRDVKLKTCAIFEMEGLREIFGSSTTNKLEDFVGRIVGLGWHVFVFATK